MRSWVAALCVALMAVIVAQAPIASVDQAQHEQGVAHLADARAGQIVAHADSDDHHHDHRPAAESAVNDDAGALSHHHHLADAPHLWIVQSDEAAWPPPLKAVLAPGAEAARPISRIFGLDRPPRALLERTA